MAFTAVLLSDSFYAYASITLLRNTSDHELCLFRGLDGNREVIQAGGKGKHVDEELFLRQAAKMKEGDSVTFLGATDAGDSAEEAVVLCLNLLKRKISVRFLIDAYVDSDECARNGMSPEQTAEFFRGIIKNMFSVNSRDKMSPVSAGKIHTLDKTKKKRYPYDCI